jgi:MraZ protein
MFLGEYFHTFDPKNRISIPAKLRKGLGHSIVLTRGVDRCLYLYPRKAWEKVAARYAEDVNGNAARRGLARLFLAGSFDTEVDTGGRVLVPENLKIFAALKERAVIAGVAGRIEIWDEEEWKKYSETLERDAVAFVEKVDGTQH